MTWKKLIKFVKSGCKGCKHQDEDQDNSCGLIDCNMEATPEVLRETRTFLGNKLGLAWICEECGDAIVTNLFGEEDENEYRCNECKGIDDNGEVILTSNPLRQKLKDIDNKHKENSDEKT